MFLLGLWPRLHFFKWAEGKTTALVLYGLLFSVLLLWCMADIGYLHSFGSRLQGTVIGDLAKETTKWHAYIAGNMWWLLFVFVAGFVWLFEFIILRLHRAISETHSRDKSGMRLFWQIALVVICVVAIYGDFAAMPLSVAELSKTSSQPIVQLAVNPIESLFNSLPAINKPAARDVEEEP
jgi:hypothetical protein